MQLARAGGDYDVLSRQPVAGLVDGDVIRTLQDAGPLHMLDLVLAEEHRYPARQPVDHAAAAVDGFAEVRPDTLDADPIFARVLHEVENFGVPQQRLGGDASPVQAYTAEGVSFHNHGLHAQLSGADRGYVSARTRAEYRNVIISICQ